MRTKKSEQCDPLRLSKSLRLFTKDSIETGDVEIRLVDEHASFEWSASGSPEDCNIDVRCLTWL